MVVIFMLAVVILTVTSFIHLGHSINSDLNDKNDIWHRRRVLLDKSITYFVTFQNLLMTYVINCSDLIVAVFLDVSFGI